MKDLDEQLKNAAQPMPRRELSHDFTAQIVSELKENPSTQVHQTKENIFMKLFHKPAIVAAAFAAIIVLGGATTYAATDGFTRPFNLSNILSFKEEKQSNGSRIVKVETNNCSSVTFSDQKLSEVSDQTILLRIKSDSKTSTENILRYVQGYCEYRASVKASADSDRVVSDAEKFYLDTIETVGKELEQVALCSNDESGYCLVSATDLDQDTDQDAAALATKADAYIKNAYNAYSANATEPAKAAFKQYVTLELAAVLDRGSDTDTITCSQAPLASLSYGSPQTKGNKVVIMIQGSFEGGSPFSLVQVTYDGSLDKISSIDCAIR